MDELGWRYACEYHNKMARAERSRSSLWVIRQDCLMDEIAAVVEIRVFEVWRTPGNVFILAGVLGCAVGSSRLFPLVRTQYES